MGEMPTSVIVVIVPLIAVVGGILLYAMSRPGRYGAGIDEVEQALLDADRRRMVDTMTQGVVYQSSDGAIVSANPAAERILGVSLGELKGRTSMVAPWRATHDDGTDFPGHTHPAVVALKTGKPVNDANMCVFNPRDKQYYWIRINAVPLFRPDADEPHGVYTTFDDITELYLDRLELARHRDNFDGLEAERVGRLGATNELLMHQVAERERAERQLRASQERSAAILDIAPGAVITIGEDHRIELFNQGAERIFGHVAAEIIGQPLDVLLPERFHEMHGGFIEEFGHSRDRTRMMGTRREIVGIRSDGAEFPATASIAHLDFGDRRLFTVVLHDITERKTYEEQLQQSQKMEAVGQLTGGIAHDFNNLLAVITGNLEILQEELGEHPDIRRYADQAIIATRRGTSLTRRLLAFSRKQKLQPTVVSMNRLIDDMTDLLRRTLGEAIEIETVLSGGLWRCVADRAQLENVLLNLTLNARDAMPDGGKLTITASNTRLDGHAAQLADVPSGEYVLLSVTDTGKGMPPEVAARAFDPFFTTKEVGKGSGLGLSMVFGFVKQSGGHVNIHTRPNQGTTVRFYLPRGERAGRDAESDIGENDESDPIDELEPQGSGELILVVEDSEEVRSLVVTMLSRLGYRSIEAGDGPTGLKMLAMHPDAALLLTDVALPGGMNGAQIARAAMDMKPGIEVLYTTGYTESAGKHLGLLAEDVEVLPKPFRKATLARKIRLLLDSPSYVNNQTKTAS